MKCKKVKYSSEKDALFALDKIRLDSNRKVIPIRAYHCHCGLWHLTSRLDIKDIQKENEKLRTELSELKNKNLDLENKILTIINTKDPKLQLILKRDVTIQYKNWELNKVKEKISKLEEENLYLLSKVEYLSQKQRRNNT